jgi:hypothetical protein
MFSVLLFFHSLFRWFVLGSLLYAIYRAYRGCYNLVPFTKIDNSIRHWTATTAHIQLMLGIIIYSKSDTVKPLFRAIANTGHITEPVFFGVIHISMMLSAIIVITIGSARAKRQATHHEKFRTMLIWFSIALALIFIAIPWPFSPFAHRPYLRSF